MEFCGSWLEIFTPFVFILVPLIMLLIPDHYLAKILGFVMKGIGSEKRLIEKEKEDLQLVVEAHFLAKNCCNSIKILEYCKMFFAQNPALVNAALPPYGYTPFHRVCLNGCTDLILFMLNIGADVKMLSKNGDNPIYLTTHAIVTQKIKSFFPLKILIEAGCNVNHKRHNGYTPLQLAAYFGRADLVEWFIQNGADFPFGEWNVLCGNSDKTAIKKVKQITGKYIKNK